MNKTYRLVWSASRNAWIVSHEGARGRGKSGGRVKAVCGAVAAALLSLGAASVMADPPPETLPCNASGSGTTTISSDATATCLLNLAVEGVTVNVAKTISVTDTITGNTLSGSYMGVEVTTDAGAIINGGTILGTSTGIVPAPVYDSADESSALVSGFVANFPGAGIHLKVGGTDTGITNSVSGLISGVSSGTASGDFACGYQGRIVYVSNFFGAGIYLEGGGITTDGITNAGTISGLSTQNGYDPDACDYDGGKTGNYTGFGIALSSNNLNGGNEIFTGSTISGGIANEGLIIGSGARGTGIFGGFITALSGIDRRNVNTGITRISGNITNDGTIQGIGTTGSGSGTGIYVSNGTITGDIANTGLISGSSPKYGGGIYLYEVLLSGAITNNGGTVSGSGSGNGGDGIYLNGATLSGGITNNSVIKGDGSSAAGIYQYNGLLSGGITNSGKIQGVGAGSSGVGIYAEGSITGGITNSGTILGSGSSGYGIYVYSGVIEGGITNSGKIQGNVGIFNTSGAISGGITNSGLIDGIKSSGGSIQGDIFAINNAAPGTLDLISLYYNTQVIGDVQATGADVYVGENSGSNYVQPTIVTGGGSFASAKHSPHRTTLKADARKGTKKAKGGSFASTDITFANTNAFDVNSFTVMDGETFKMSEGGSVSGGLATRGIKVSNGFTNSGTLIVDAGVNPTVTGNFTQTEDSGVFQTGGTTPDNFGKLTITGTATLPSSAKFKVVTDTGGACSDLAVGDTISGVISSIGTLTAATFATVEDDCDNLDFTAHQNGNAVDLWVVAGSGSASGTCGIATTLPVSSAPSVDLCSEGTTASGMAGSGPWTWNCGEASCSAPLYTAPPVTYYTPPPPPSTEVDLPTGGGTATPTQGQTVNVVDNGKENSTIDLPPPPTAPLTGTPGTTGTPPPTGININLPGAGTVSVSSDSGGTKLGVQGVTMPGETKQVSTVMVTQGSASFTATKEGQPIASLKNGIFVVSGATDSKVTVDATGPDTKIGVKSSDTIVVPTGSTGVSGTSVDLPSPTATGGAASTVSVKIGTETLTIQSSQADTKMTFKVVDIGGVQTPILEVTGSAQVSGSGDNQPIVSIAGNVIKTGKGKSGGSSQVCNTIVQASSDSSSDVVHVVTCYIVLEAGTFSAMNGGGNNFAAIKDGIVWAGETAEFDKNGKVTSAYLGSRLGLSDAVGDDVVPGGAKFAASGYNLNAFIPRLSGTPLRLNGAKLDERIFSVINQALGVAVQPALPVQSDQGVLNFTFNGSLNGLGVQNPQVNYTINADTASIAPSRRIRVDTSRADGVSISAEGEVDVATGGLVTTFVPSVADPKAFAEKISQTLPGATITQRWNGSWHVTAADGATYVGRPQWSFWAVRPGAATFSTTPDGNLLYSDHGRAQPLFPDFYDYDTLQATFRTELKDPALTVLPRMDGTATATVNGQTYTLAPQWNLIKPAAGKPAWWMENGVVYIKNADGSAQGFAVK